MTFRLAAAFWQTTNLVQQQPINKQEMQHSKFTIVKVYFFVLEQQLLNFKMAGLKPKPQSWS